jgi:hypothetical protein
MRLAAHGNLLLLVLPDFWYTVQDLRGLGSILFEGQKIGGNFGGSGYNALLICHSKTDGWLNSSIPVAPPAFASAASEGCRAVA